jgi:hypothetical protein
MSYTKLNYPAAFASEGNPLNGGFPGDFDPYVHGVNDTMDIDDDTGFPVYWLWVVIKVGSTWRDSQNWQLPLLWSKVGGIILGGEQLIRR